MESGLLEQLSIQIARLRAALANILLSRSVSANAIFEAPHRNLIKSQRTLTPATAPGHLSTIDLRPPVPGMAGLGKSASCFPLLWNFSSTVIWG
jgi:hypothetical protein